MIVTLAGHVDHGKTSLVKALTGVDTDRLDEEKRRGLTIDLGFAYTDLDGHRIGFVDVPGHHRFVHNMVAGVAAHQLGLVVVAADDGVMPQTLEHLQILGLIGVQRAVFALTKVDRVASERIAAVRDQIEQLAQAHGLQDCHIVETSVVDGSGVDALRAVLSEAARTEAASDRDGQFRLAIDRAFVIRGSGLVVTGTVHSGTTSVGDELVLAPGGAQARVRSLHVQDTEAEHAGTGDRCAINLSGLERTEAKRGDWLIAPGAYAPTRTVVIDLTVLDDFPRTVKHWLPVHVYHATAHTTGHVALLASAPLGAGERALVELALDEPLHPKHGDAIVLRDYARERTIGGGPVIEIAPARGGRRNSVRLAQLSHQVTRDPEQALDALLAGTEVGIDVEAFARLRNLSAHAMDTLMTPRDLVTIERDGHRIAYAGPMWHAWQNHVVERIEAYHKSAPHSPGLTADQLAKVADVSRALLPNVLDQLQSEGRIRQSGGHYQSVAFRARLPEAEERRLRQIEQLLDAGDQPPSLGDLAKQIGGNLRTLQSAAREFAKTGRIVVVSDNRAFLPEQIKSYAAVAERLQRESSDGFTVRAFRDATGIGRNLAIEVLEFFDARGYTRRYDDKRRIVGDASSLKIA